MARRIVLLRGINLGPRNRVAMPALRRSLTEAGFADVRTYVQSGNIVLSSSKAAAQLERECRHLLATEFGLEIEVIARTRDELAKVVKRNPLAQIATNPKRYQVSFLSAKLPAGVLDKLTPLKADTEELVAVGREVYAYHPDGVARSKLWTALAGRGLGVTATARNWNTVTTLLQMADDVGAKSA